MFNESSTARVKKLARNAALRRKKQIFPDEFEAAGEKMAAFLYKSTAYQKANTIFCYVSKKNEPSTWLFLSKVLDDGKQLCVPRCGLRGVMSARLLTSLDELKPGLYGIKEPASEALEIDPKEIDFCVVPCLAAGRDGTRLGHGSGYYDRYLPKLSKRVYSVTLCIEKMLCDTIPTETHDVTFGRILTERGFVSSAAK